MEKFEERLKDMMDNSELEITPPKDANKLVKELEERETLARLRSLKRSFGFVKFKDFESKERFLAEPLRIFGMTPSPAMHFKMDDADFKTTLICANLPKKFPLHQFLVFLNLHLKTSGLPTFESDSKIRNLVVSSEKVYLTFNNFEQAMRASLLLNQLEFSGRSIVATFLEGPIRYIGGKCFEDLDFLKDDYRQMKLDQADRQVKERLSLLPKSDYLKISERSALEKKIRMSQDHTIWNMNQNDFFDLTRIQHKKLTVKKGDQYSKMVDFITNLVDLQTGENPKKREMKTQKDTTNQNNQTENKKRLSKLKNEKPITEEEIVFDKLTQEKIEIPNDDNLDLEEEEEEEEINPIDIIENKNKLSRNILDNILIGVETKIKRKKE